MARVVTATSGYTTLSSHETHASRRHERRKLALPFDLLNYDPTAER
jgi:hypothetical protein